MAFFGLKLGLDLEMRAAHPHQEFQGVPPPPAPGMILSKRVFFHVYIAVIKT